jgi:acyl carrier protein
MNQMTSSGKIAFINDQADSGQHVVLAPPITPAKLRAFLARMDSAVDLEKLQDTTPFSDAGADSLDFFNIISEIQAASGIEIADQDIEQVNTLAGLAAYLNTKLS